MNSPSNPINNPSKQDHNNSSPSKSGMGHAECVKYATKYLSKRCNVVLPEFFTHNAELPDVIGFKNEISTVIECKVSRGDFFSDKKKYFRLNPEKGMGDYRFYCCPKGMVSKDELPTGWGLLYVYPSGRVMEVKSSHVSPADPTDWQKRGRFDKNKDAELHLLYYYARRANYAGVHKAIIEYRGYDV